MNERVAATRESYMYIKKKKDKVVRIELEGATSLPTAITRPQLLYTRPRQAQKRHQTVCYGRVSRRSKVFYDTVQIIHHFPPRTMPHESSPRCASRLPPPHHQRAIQYVRAMALSIPSAPVPNRIIHSEERMGITRKRAEYPMAASLGSSVGFCGHYRLTGTVSFYSVFSPILV